MSSSEYDKVFQLRKGKESDISIIRFYAEKFNLDSEELIPQNIYVIEINGQLAGFGRHKEHGNICEISTVGVLEEYRNNGAGKILVNCLILTAPAAEIWLTTIIPEFFKKFGFQICENVPLELIFKTERLCKKFNKSPENNTFMRLITR